jgi:hypothetical protein
VNLDLLSEPSFVTHFEYLSVSSRAVLSDVADLTFLLQGSSTQPVGGNHSFFLHPIHGDFSSDANLVGFIVGVISWESLFTDQISESSGKVLVVLHNSCGTQMTYEINGPDAVFLGKGDFHDCEYDSMEVSVLLNEAIEGLNQCIYGINVYPTDDFHSPFDTSAPWVYSALAVFMFFFTASKCQRVRGQLSNFAFLDSYLCLPVTAVFTIYDFLVQRRQRHVVDKADRTNQLVSTLFPSNVRDRLLGQNTVQDDFVFQDDNKTVRSNLTAEYLEKTKVTGDLGPVDPTNPYETKPIADLFPEATVRKLELLMDTAKVRTAPSLYTYTICLVFADIVGFTAWSSVREPTQVRW